MLLQASGQMGTSKITFFLIKNKKIEIYQLLYLKNSVKRKMVYAVIFLSEWFTRLGQRVTKKNDFDCPEIMIVGYQSTSD